MISPLTSAGAMCVTSATAAITACCKRERFYQQEYCGCVYSLRDSNRHRRAQGRERIRIGLLYYGDRQD